MTSFYEDLTKVLCTIEEFERDNKERRELFGGHQAASSRETAGGGPACLRWGAAHHRRVPTKGCSWTKFIIHREGRGLAIRQAAKW